MPRGRNLFSFEQDWGGCKRYVVLDSDVICRDFWMRGAGFRTLRNILTLVDAQVLLPRVVITETISNFRQSLLDSLRPVRQLDRLLDRRALPEIDVAAEVARYRNYVKKLFWPRVLDDPGPSLFARLPYPKVRHAHVVKRLTLAKKPFRGGKDKEKGYLDFLVWLSVVMVAKEEPDAKAVFVSQNVKDFTVRAGENCRLHPDLLADLPTGRQVDFYGDLDSLLDDLLAELGSKSRAFLDKHPDLLERLAEEIVPPLLDRWLENFLAPIWNDGRVYKPLAPSSVVVELRKVTPLPNGLTAILLDASYWPRWFYEEPDDDVMDNSTTVAITLQVNDELEALAADVEGDVLDLPPESAAPASPEPAF